VTPPDLNLSVVGPIVWAGLGAMLVLMGEVFLSRRKTFLGRKMTESTIGSLLALVAMASLARRRASIPRIRCSSSTASRPS
jgi:hypothetical protein